MLCLLIIVYNCYYNELSKINRKIDNTKQILTNNITKLAEQKTDFQLSRKIRRRFFSFLVGIKLKIRRKNAQQTNCNKS